MMSQNLIVPKCFKCGGEGLEKHRNSRNLCVSCFDEEGYILRQQELYERRALHLKYKYDLTHDDYDRMLDGQNGVCAICKRPPKKKRLSVDHDHATGSVRGLLCTRCNLGLGYFRDKPWMLQSAADYLLRPLSVEIDT